MNISILALLSQAVQVTSGTALDYQPAMRLLSEGRVFVVYEVLDPGDLSGDLYSVYSTDRGATWSSPAPVITSPASERHPALVQMPDGTLYLYYLSDSTAQYRIHMASSTDGVIWTFYGPTALGWTGGEHQINPEVVFEADSSLSMSYQLMTAGYSNLGGYVSHSDDGFSWDLLMRQADAGARLPRITKWRDSVYIVTYQQGSGSVYDIFYRTSQDLTNWTAEMQLTATSNSHDSHPVPMGDSAVAVFYATAPGSSYDIYYQVSHDLASWDPEVRITNNNLYDNQPHGLCVDDTLWVIWSQSVYPTPYQDHDLYFQKLPKAVVNQETGGEPGGLLDLRPNPCTRGSVISLALAEGGIYRVAVYDPCGRLVQEVFRGELGQGLHSWATGDLRPGVYLVICEGVGSRETSALVVK